MAVKPIILFEGTYTSKDLKEFRKHHPIWKEIDVYKDQVTELFEIDHPHKIKTDTFKNELENYLLQRLGDNADEKGNWVYFPWNGHFIHSVSEDEYYALRTNRNKLIITDGEQEKLHNSCVGFLGLSIGQHMVLSLAYNGIANSMKLAEFDTLSTSNLNRVRAGIKDIGKSKSDIVSEHLYEINPYQNIVNYPDGLNDKVIHEFFDKEPQPDIVFEACDDFKMKIKIRIEARKRRIPVIMLTNLADSILVDIERFDLNPALPVFHGLLGELPDEILQREITEKDKVRFAKDLVGVDFLPNRVLRTLHEINRTLVGRPQLNSTVTIAGGVASYLARRIILQKAVWSGRKHIPFSKVFGFDEFENEEERREIIEKLNAFVEKK